MPFGKPLANDWLDTFFSKYFDFRKIFARRGIPYRIERYLSLFSDSAMYTKCVSVIIMELYNINYSWEVSIYTKVADTILYSSTQCSILQLL